MPARPLDSPHAREIERLLSLRAFSLTAVDRVVDLDRKTSYTVLSFHQQRLSPGFTKRRRLRIRGTLAAGYRPRNPQAPRNRRRERASRERLVAWLDRHLIDRRSPILARAAAGDYAAVDELRALLGELAGPATTPPRRSRA
jgi:hypothetical protein